MSPRIYARQYTYTYILFLYMNSCIYIYTYYAHTHIHVWWTSPETQDVSPTPLRTATRAQLREGATGVEDTAKQMRLTVRVSCRSSEMVMSTQKNDGFMGVNQGFNGKSPIYGSIMGYIVLIVAISRFNGEIRHLVWH